MVYELQGNIRVIYPVEDVRVQLLIVQEKEGEKMKNKVNAYVKGPRSPDVKVLVLYSPEVNESCHSPPRAPLVTYALRVRTIAPRGRTAAPG